jgi:hypothetical protein
LNCKEGSCPAKKDPVEQKCVHEKTRLLMQEAGFKHVAKVAITS